MDVGSSSPLLRCALRSAGFGLGTRRPPIPPGRSNRQVIVCIADYKLTSSPPSPIRLSSYLSSIRDTSARQFVIALRVLISGTGSFDSNLVPGVLHALESETSGMLHRRKM